MWHFEMDHFRWTPRTSKQKMCPPTLMDRARTWKLQSVPPTPGPSNEINRVGKINKLLVSQSNVRSVQVIFGPSLSLKDDSPKLVSWSDSGSRLHSIAPSTPTIPMSSRPFLSTPPPVSAVLPQAAECKLCSDLQKQVESWKKRIELLEGKAPVR